MKDKLEKKKMRLCFISNRIHNPITGGEFYNESLLNGGELAGYTIERWEGIKYDNIRNRFIKILSLNIRYFLKVLRLSQKDILLVDIDFCFRYIVALIFARYFQKIRIIGVLHHYCHLLNNGVFNKYVHLFVERFVSKRIDYLIVNSQFSRRNFLKLTKSNIPYILLTPFSRELKLSPIQKVTNHNNQLKLLQIGTIDHRKNVLNAVIAASMIKTPFTFDFIGHCYSGSYFQKIDEYVKSNNLSDKVFFRGVVNRAILENFFLNSTIFVLVSRLEGYGMVYAEAMQYGLPIIGSTTGSVPDLVIDGENGYLCDPENPEQIADAIMKLTDKDNWERISNNNFKKSAELMDKETFLEKSTELFTKISTWYPSRLTSI